ncbi:hypothetical protein N7492_005761 [Penicillium capsulatum]|uniref:Organic solute transporter Ostalpha-domain-containing protein n=1 Tax=Penicillium capsulatum TaxID=69766 RepID=A0A9W9LSG2_9EURO|nr:hypothetical protein N7492_005761 [Penicillium capsulatum]KAJ6135141.1 hypothetical protein N7512_000301 [Penicillium capsulatum]
MSLLGPRAEAALGSHGCSLPDHLENAGGGPFVGSLSFYQFSMIVSGACTGIVLILMFGLMGRHATHMSNPNEQLKIMRVVNMIPSYQVLSFISICFPNAYLYIQGFTEVFQGIALYAFLMLLCDFMAPTDQKKVEFFSSLETKRQWQPKKKRNGLAFLKLTWWTVLQYPVVTWITAIAQVVTQSLHIFCLESNEPHFAHVWIQTATSLSTSVAVNAILQFYMNMKGYMKEHHPLTKLLAFKLIVGVVLLEKILFLILTGTKVLKPNETLSGVDVMIGLPNLVICIQMVPLCFLVLYAYRTTPYEISSAPTTLRPRQYQALEGDEEALVGGIQKRYQGGWMGLHAWAVYLNPLELLRDVISAYRMITRARALQKAQMREQAAKEEETTRYDTANDNVEGA